MSSQSRLMINNYCKQGYSVLIWWLGDWRSNTPNAHIYRKKCWDDEQQCQYLNFRRRLGRGGHFALVTCNINSKTKWRFWVNDWSRSINKRKTSRCDWVHRRWCPFNERHTVVSHKCSIYCHFTEQGQPVNECYFYTLTVKNPVWVSIAHSIDLLPFL